MKLLGSCHCQSVRFEVESYTPYPFMSCYCSICRKTAGGGGYAINIMGEAKTLKVEGMEHINVYRARMQGEQPGTFVISSGHRHSCKHCASCLWIDDPSWPAWVYPFASAIDTPLPKPPEHSHIMLDSAANWCTIAHTQHDHRFTHFPTESIEEWHQRLGLYDLNK